MSSSASSSPQLCTRLLFFSILDCISTTHPSFVYNCVRCLPLPHCLFSSISSVVGADSCLQRRIAASSNGEPARFVCCLDFISCSSAPRISLPVSTTFPTSNNVVYFTSPYPVINTHRCFVLPTYPYHHSCCDYLVCVR